MHRPVAVSRWRYHQTNEWPWRDLGVLLDQELTMKQHISNVASIRRLKKVRSILGPEITANLVSSFVLNRLDYCNTLFVGLPASTIAALQRVQNVAARLVKGLSPRDHTTSYTGCLFGIVSATSYVFWRTLYIPAIVRLICLSSLLPPQISLRESVSDLTGLIVMNHWQLRWSLANAVFPCWALKLGTACPMK